MTIAVPSTAGDRTEVVATTATNTITVPIPANTVAGDVLIATIASDNANISTTTTPGWEKISTRRAGGQREIGVFHAFTTNGIPDPLVVSQSQNARLTGAMFRVTGASQDVAVSAAGLWTTDGDLNTNGMTIPATGAAAGVGITFAVAYNNANVAQGATTGATVNGQPADVHLTSYGAGSAGVSSSTSQAVKISTDNGPFVLEWGKAIANSQGLAVTIPAAVPAEVDPEPEEPEVPVDPEPVVSWEAKVMLNGGLHPAIIEAVKVGNQFVQPQLISWQPKNYTIDDLLSTPEFYIAHRGSGDNWPEHTLTSFTNAIAHGIKAIEVSVVMTSDGEFICNHDLTFQRTAGDPRRADSMTLAEIEEEIWVDSRQWTGLGTPLVHPPRLSDVLDAYVGTHVIFIEDKTGTSTTALLNVMDSYPNSTNKFVWKQWAGAGQFQAAKNRGYKTWGYLSEELFPRMEEMVNRHDYVGIPHTAPDQVIHDLVAYGKPVISWEIHYRWQRDRMRSLGVRGMMSSNVPYLYTDGNRAQNRRDTFETGIRAAGDLPHTTDQGWSLQPTIDPADGGVLRWADRRVGSYIFGSMAPIVDRNYTIGFEFRWPDRLPTSGQNVGLWFGHEKDHAHRASIASVDGGYHVVQRSNGQIDLYRHDPGNATSVLLQSVMAEVPVVGQWMKFEVSVTPVSISAKRLDTATQYQVSSSDTNWRGGYFGIQKNYATDASLPNVPAEFRSIEVREISL